MKIYLFGQENINSASDDDFNITKAALASFAEVVDNIADADVVHSVNWYALLKLDKATLQKKVVIVHIPHDVRNMLSQPEYLRVAPFIDHWLVPSKKAK